MMMMKASAAIVMSGLLMLAGARAADAQAMPVQCAVPDAPTVSVTPVSDEIQNDYSTSSRDLSMKKTDTASPYPAGTDSATGGLRVDTPTIATAVKYGDATYPGLHQSCLWYHSIDVTIKLSPHIYIAREYNALGPCRDAIMAHELHHVDVDREMMNKYSYIIGQAVQEVVDKTGAVGPIDADAVPANGQQLIDAVSAAIKTVQQPLQDEMRQRQAQVDSLEEYKRISAICYGAH
jgi:hypothetical protein